MPLHIERDGSIATIVLDRRERGNAIDVAMAEALLAAAIDLGADTATRAVVLTGAGAMFCAGGDVGSFVAAGDGAPALIHRITAPLHAAIAKLVHLDKPLVTAINGAAAGAGLGLAVLGDAAIASRSAKFTAAYGTLGLTPDAGATWLLPRLIGMRQAQRLLLAADRVDADEALRIGLIGEVTDADALLDRAYAVADRLASFSGPALRRTRSLLLDSFATGFETQLEREAQGIAEAAAHRHGREGVAAFAAKRPPLFD